MVFLLAGLSDMADGVIARRWHQRSRLGAYLDPLADKILMSASFITLAISRDIPGWLTVIVISRDVILVMGVLIFRLADYVLDIKPSRLGKWTTTFQIGTVLMVLLGKVWGMPPLVLTLVFWVTGGLTTISGILYLNKGLRQVNLAINGPTGGA
jgi:cardiolipin synthase